MIKFFDTCEETCNMATKTFFECANCGNKEKFVIFTSNFRVIKQSPEIGIRIESGVLPNLREEDNYVECWSCAHKFGFAHEKVGA